MGQCKYCVYFHYDSDTCRANPPTIVEALVLYNIGPECGYPEPDLSGRWPEVFGSESCGKFKEGDNGE